MTIPFSLRIFVADGDPDGLRLVERSNWVGKALIFPRALLPQVKQRPELAQTGVYLLLGPQDDGDGDKLYIGEGDPIRPRLESHYANKDFWTRAICFVAAAGQLNKAHVQFLESNLVRLALAAKRVPLDNGNHPAEPTLHEADRADMLVFLDNMLGMLPVLGVPAFEQVKRAARVSQASIPGMTGIDADPQSEGSQSEPTTQEVLLTCRGKGFAATGFDSAQGFVVLAGSQAAGDTGVSLAAKLVSSRQELLRRGVLELSAEILSFKQDYVFSSPSYAASMVLGRSANGRRNWKDAQGRTLKELQEREANA
jgi:hypothetical protein